MIYRCLAGMVLVGGILNGLYIFVGAMLATFRIVLPGTQGMYETALNLTVYLGLAESVIPTDMWVFVLCFFYGLAGAAIVMIPGFMMFVFFLPRTDSYWSALNRHCAAIKKNGG